jgi:hypothetical protein
MYPDHGSVDQLQMPNQTSSSSNNNNNNDEDQTPINSGESYYKNLMATKGIVNL